VRGEDVNIELVFERIMHLSKIVFGIKGLIYNKGGRY